MLEDNFGFDKAYIDIPMLSIFTTIKNAKDVKKVFYWLETTSYIIDDVHSSFIETGVAWNSIIVIKFVLKKFLDDIPDGVDGFEKL
jgi:hypothetical protein